MEKNNDNKIPALRWMHIIPPCVLIYIVAFMDRTNIGFALTGGMNKDLGISVAIAGLVSGIFFVGYLFLQVPGGNYAERKSAKKYITVSLIAWGILSILSGCVTSLWQMITLRFLLGVAEGGVWPAVLAIISHWFPNEERGRANGFFVMNIAIASIITGPLSGWIISFSSWRWVFILEGCVAFVLIFVWYPLITDRPEDATWLSEEERTWIITKLKSEQKEVSLENKDKKSIYTNPELWKLTVTYFCYQVGIYGFILWLPNILKELTKTSISIVGLLSIFPYVAMLFGIWFFSMLSDKTLNRKLFTILPMLLFAIVLLLSVQFRSHIWVSYVFLVLCGLFQQGYCSSFWSMPPAIFDGNVVGSARGVINALGCLGGFVGPLLVGALTAYINSNAGMIFLAITLIVGCIVNTTIKFQNPTDIDINEKGLKL